jgi:homocysteine S-methyltransferase
MASEITNPLDEILERQGVIVLDGGLASALEARGHDLADPLWSARILLESPAAIREAHLDYLRAGADCLVTASYQASFAGLRARGLSDGESAALLRYSVTLAESARDQFLKQASDRPRPLVAASVGPYGAALADGSEYRGNYSISEEGLRAFHEPRWRALAESGADLLACETIPSLPEARVLLRLLAETPARWAWLSFSCRDGDHLCDGSPLREAASICDSESRLAAIGINCTAPVHIASLIAAARSATNKPIIVYPNAGERYDAASKSWSAGRAVVDWGEAALEWRRSGAVGIGGCCRVGPDEIARMRSRLVAC